MRPESELFKDLKTQRATADRGVAHFEKLSVDLSDNSIFGKTDLARYVEGFASLQEYLE